VAPLQFLKLYGVTGAVLFACDLVWLGVVAKEFYRRHLPTLLRADVRWGPGLLFYLLYVAALVVFVLQPALERQSLARAVVLGAFFGLTAYATYDLTSLALIRDFPTLVAVVDIAWGTALTAAVSAAGYAIGRLVLAPPL
jgi:uncharacterized membrane protein